MTKARDLANASTALSAVDATELGYLDGVTSAVQTQLNAKLASSTAATTYVANSLADAKGDLLTATADNTPARLAVGANNTVLTADSSTATGLKWATPAGGGKVLQVVMGSTSSTMTTSSSTYADTNLTGTITPSSASSKVLVIATQNGCLKFGGTAANGMGLKLLRGATDIVKMADAGMILQSNTANNGDYSFSVSYLDSPATTSATTYKTQANASGNAVQMILQNGGCLSTIILLEIGA